MTDTTAAVPKVGTHQQREAIQMLHAFATSITELTSNAFPQVIVTVGGTFEDPETTFTCPWCKAEISRDGGVREMDLSVRHNDAHFEPDREGEIEGTVGIHQGDGNYETLCYITACCSTPVDLPDGWEVTWG